MSEPLDPVSLDRGLMVRLAWNSRGWCGQSDVSGDVEQSNFGDVVERGSAHEWWNFHLEHPCNTDGHVYGFFYPASRHRPRVSPDETLAVFFASRDWRDGVTYVVGAYLGASYSHDGWAGVGEKEDQTPQGAFSSWSTLRCPRDQVWIARPTRVLRLDPERHLRGAAIGRGNYTYLGREQLERLIEDLAGAEQRWRQGLIDRLVLPPA